MGCPGNGMFVENQARREEGPSGAIAMPRGVKAHSFHF
jgi:hypothetical protein